MAIMLFVVGVFLYFTRRFSFGSLRTEGRHVRAAGLVLMSPVIFTFFLSLFAGMIFGGSLETLVLLFNVLALVELAMLFGSAFVAYLLIANPPNAPRLPGILGDIQQERQGEQPPAAAEAPAPPRPAPESFPTILTVAQAARYLDVSEADILTLIDDGKLAAARINYTYRIARSNLDELLAAREPSAV